MSVHGPNPAPASLPVVHQNLKIPGLHISKSRIRSPLPQAASKTVYGKAHNDTHQSDSVPGEAIAGPRTNRPIEINQLYRSPIREIDVDEIRRSKPKIAFPSHFNGGTLVARDDRIRRGPFSLRPPRDDFPSQKIKKKKSQN